MGFDNVGCSFRGIVGRWKSENPKESEIRGCCMAMGAAIPALAWHLYLILARFSLPIVQRIHIEVIYSERIYESYREHLVLFNCVLFTSSFISI